MRERKKREKKRKKMILRIYKFYSASPKNHKVCLKVKLKSSSRQNV